MKVHALELHVFLPIRVACDICEGRNQKVEVPIGRVAICTLSCDIPVPVSLGLPNRERVELSFYVSLPLGWLIISRINICIDLNVIIDFMIPLTAWVGCFWCSDLEVGLIMLSLKASQRLEIFLERQGTHMGHLFPVLSKHVLWKVWKQFNLTVSVIKFSEHSA